MVNKDYDPAVGKAMSESYRKIKDVLNVEESELPEFQLDEMTQEVFNACMKMTEYIMRSTEFLGDMVLGDNKTSGISLQTLLGGSIGHKIDKCRDFNIQLLNACALYLSHKRKKFEEEASDRKAPMQGIKCVVVGGDDDEEPEG